MTNRLRSVLLAGAASLGLGALTIGPARALLALLPNPSDFVFIETGSAGGGTYTIINKSSDWYIFAFDVTNPAAGAGGIPTTGQTDWATNTCNNNCSVTDPAFTYGNVNGAFLDISNDVGPGETSSLFGWLNGPPASDVKLFFSNGNLNNPVFGTLTPTGTVPEPSTWAMLIAGFGLLGWRYGVQRGGLKRLLGAA